MNHTIIHLFLCRHISTVHGLSHKRTLSEFTYMGSEGKRWSLLQNRWRVKIKIWWHIWLNISLDFWWYMNACPKSYQVWRHLKRAFPKGYQVCRHFARVTLNLCFWLVLECSKAFMTHLWLYDTSDGCELQHCNAHWFFKRAATHWRGIRTNDVCPCLAFVHHWLWSGWDQMKPSYIRSHTHTHWTHVLYYDLYVR